MFPLLSVLAVLLLVIALFAVTAGAIDASSSSQAEADAFEGLRKLHQVQTKRIKVRLSDIDMKPDRFRHREDEALLEDALKALMVSLAMEGVQEPIEVYYDKVSKKFVVVKGHRRVTACRLLAAKNTSGFTADMELEAIEVENFTEQDLVVRSIADNENRLNLDRKGRIKAAVKLHQARVDVSRAAAALGISSKSYQRDLSIGRNPWMRNWVFEDCIDATAAVDLVDVAEKEYRLPELKEDLEAWIKDKKSDIQTKHAIRQLEDGKDLSAAEKQVKRLMPRHLVDHWIDLMRRKQRFDENSEWEFAARIDKEKGQLHIGSANLDLDKDPPEMIAKVASKLSALSKQLAPVVQKRLASPQQADDGEERPYDLDYLKQLGADNLADRLEKKFGATRAGKAEARAVGESVAGEEADSGGDEEKTAPKKK